MRPVLPSLSSCYSGLLTLFLLAVSICASSCQFLVYVYVSYPHILLLTLLLGTMLSVTSSVVF